MKKILYTITIILVVIVSCVKDEIYVPPTPEESAILLNEIQSKDPITDLDWIELYNSGDQDVDISGYMINDAADPVGGFIIPSGTIITANGYYVVEQPELTISISSSGEDVSLGDSEGTLLDLVACPASAADGTTFGRETDGAQTWLEGMIATKGSANGDGKITVPILTLDFPVAPAAGDEVNVVLSYITTETVVEARVYYSVGDAPEYAKDNKIKGEDLPDFTQTGVTIPMKDVITGDDLSVADELVSFYVRLALENGIEYYYDKDGNPIADDGNDDTDDGPSDDFKADPTQWNIYKAISGGVAAPTLTIDFSATPTMGSELLGLTFSSEINIVEARVYFGYGDSPSYVKNNKIKGEDDVSFTQTGVTIDMSEINVEDDAGTIIGNTSDGSKISFYVRIALENGVEYYFDKDGNVIIDDGNDDTDDGPSNDFKADPTKWNSYTPKAAVAVSKYDFPANPATTDDIKIDLEYSSNETITEVRAYYALGDTPVYIKDNKVKGEDDPSFTQTGVIIDMSNLDIVDADGNIVGTTSDSGAKISFYVRIATATSEYYYGKDGLIVVDDSPGGSTSDGSDDFKADPTLWNQYIVQ